MVSLVPCVPGGVAGWKQTTAFDGVSYQLTFTWVQRMGRWMLSVADVGGAPIVSGVALVAGVSVFAGIRDTRRPPGLLLVIDSTDAGNADPGFADLGTRFLLVYADAAELAGFVP